MACLRLFFQEVAIALRLQVHFSRIALKAMVALRWTRVGGSSASVEECLAWDPSAVAAIVMERVP